MNDQRLKDALREATDTREVVIGDSVLDRVPEVFERCFDDARAVLICDENTLSVAGVAVQHSLEEADRAPVERFVFPGRPVLYADYENIEKLVGWLKEHQGTPVAVGSGTLNDIVKRAAFECERPYMTVATAASMDGYASFGASITKDGFKHTMECPAPRAVLADLATLVEAPARMTSSGYGDLLAKIPAGGDWIVADVLEVEPIEPKAWELVQEPLRDATGRPGDLRAGDRAAMEGLIDGLIMSGLAMQATSSSRPASGAEHQFSHLWEMEGLGQHPENDDEPPLSHGFKVGIGTVSISALYGVALELDLSALDAAAIAARWPSWEEVERRVREAHPDPRLTDRVIEQSRAKYVDARQLEERLTLLRQRWPALRDRLREQLLPAEVVREQLQLAGCPTTPGEIGVEIDRFKATYRRAQMIRSRYTVLDLLNEAGQLDQCVEALFADGGFWQRQLSAARA
jgi:glycerol-1-phosphate dehydrogenase [NAD(P)+]